MLKKINPIIVLFFVLISLSGKAQTTIGTKIDFLSPKEYTIMDVMFEGADNFDQNALKLITEISRGDKVQVPGEAFTKAIRKLWDQKLFSDVQIYAQQIRGSDLWILIKVKERPRIKAFKFTGDVSKSEADKLREEIDLFSGQILTENLKINTKNKVRNYYRDKKYLRAEITLKDSLIHNGVLLVIDAKLGKRIKINAVNFEGNELYSDKKLKRLMKKTKEKAWYNVFSPSKFMTSLYETDKEMIVAKYNEAGYRDAKIVRDSVYDFDEKTINVDLDIKEGNKYFFRNITWLGNAKYSSGRLDTILGIKKGDVYNKTLLDQRLFMSQNGRDISSLYMDRGYLFFNINPVEVLVENDSIDIEMRINEGKQARYKDIIIKGNERTNEHVIRRMIRTKPGELFSRDEIIRTQRELGQLPFLNAENFQVNPIPNPVDGTVDIEYGLEERSSDQIELSGGWGGGRVIGTLGLSFNNFSAKNMFKKGSWRPIPSGDGQTLSVRAQANGRFYQSYNISFTEPWLGGKKPNALSVSGYHSRISRSISTEFPSYLTITGATIGLGRINKWPDDYFNHYIGLNYQLYNINNYGNFFIFDNGISHNINAQFNLSRNSIDRQIYARSGSELKFTAKSTIPYSFFDGKSSYNDLTPQELYKFVEYYKLKFTSTWYTPLSKDKEKKFVLYSKVGFGFLGAYNRQKGIAPFERFYLGGSGLTGVNQFDGREIVALRGYPNDNSPPVSPTTGGAIITKYTTELRYLISPNPSATIYILGFAEAGNTWTNYKLFNPFNVKRSAGIGARVFLPMFGLLGVDYGWGFDYLDAGSAGNSPRPFVPGTGQFHFTIGMNLGEL